jgi:hypothetical protein
MIETNIHDKDGVSATVRVHRLLQLAMAMIFLILEHLKVAFVELVTELHTRGLSALQYLEHLYEW